ncbi:hypothetical protein MMC22_007193 [Lobaria immixta]|nr:hypothetical protein [Lobaria immixta]
MSLENLKQAIRETANEHAGVAQDPPLEDALAADAVIEDAPAPPMFGFDTSLKEINEAIRRAEFRSLHSDSLKESVMRKEVVQGLNDGDGGASSANEATIRRLTAENQKFKSQVVRFLES